MLGAFIDLHLMIKHNRIAQDECLERHEIRDEQKSVKKNRIIVKWITASLAVLNGLLYCFYVKSKQSESEEAIKFSITFYSTVLEIVIATFLVAMTRILLTMSRKQYTRRK